MNARTALLGGRPAHLPSGVLGLARRRRARWVVVLLALIASSLVFPGLAEAQSPPAFGSDDFNRASLGSGWAVVDPAGDGTVAIEGFGSGDSRLHLSVPAGSAHEPYNANGALRAMRPAADTDFTAVARFQSAPTLRYQMQGILVQQDGDDWLRFEVNHNGSALKAYAGTTTAGATTSRLQKTTSAASYLRVQRTGDTWVLATSADGTAWSTAGSFTHAVDITSIGVFAGNAGAPAPAFSAAVDYFFEASNPVTPEDGGAPPPESYTLATDASGPGSVTRSPDKPTYGAGEIVTLTAVPNAGAAFTGWSGGVTGATNPTSITINGNTTITAGFAADATPPVLSGVAVAPGHNSAVVTWTTNEPASSSVSAGPTTAYELGAFGSAAATTTHAVTISGLAPATTYHFRPSSTNTAGLVGTGADATFTTDPAPAQAFPSDDFNRAELGPAWEFVNPLNDGTATMVGQGTADARLRLSVPAGQAHDPWNVNNSVRAMRAAADIDFAADLKFDSTPTAKYQSQGLIVEQDADDWLRFNVHYNGSSLRAYASTTLGGTPTKRVDVPAPSAASLWLRVQRTGDTWTFRTSTNGTSWTTAGSFTQALDVTKLGPFVGNSGSPVPAFTAQVDYVFDAAAPLDPEDTPPSSVTYPVTTNVVGAGSVTRSPDLAAYPQGSQVTLTAVPGAGASFAGWSGALAGGDNPATLTVDAAKTVTATFQPDTTPPVISGVGAAPASTSAVVTWTTDEPATSSVSFGSTSAYENGAIGSNTPTRKHSVTLTGLSPGASYHYRVASTNTAGLVATGADGTFTMATSTGPAVDVWYGNNQVVGANGEVQNAYNLLGKVTDPDGVAALSYTLNGGTSRALTIGPTLRRVYNPGDFNADITWGGLDPGANTVVLTARDSLGNITATTVTLQKQSGSAPLPYTVDWSSMARITDRAQVVDGRWRLDGDTVHVQELGYDRLVMVGDASWKDYEVTVPVTVHSIGPGHNTHLSNEALVGLALNWRGHTARNGDQPVWDWYPTGALAWYRYFDTPKFEMYGNDNSPAVRHQRFRMNFGQTYMFKARSETISTTQVRYSWKVWPQGQAEPATWDLTLVEDNGPMTGSIGVIAHHVDAQFGDISVAPIAP